MQVWNQVKVIDQENPHNGQAGVVQQVKESGMNIVKLDTEELPLPFRDDQLQVLC